MVPQRIPTPPPLPDLPERQQILSLNLSAEDEELLTACDTSQSKVSRHLAEAREALENLQPPSRTLSPSHTEEKGTDGDDEAMDTSEKATETTDADSDYRPSTCHSSEETSVSTSQDIPEKELQKPGDGDPEEDDGYGLFSLKDPP